MTNVYNKVVNYPNNTLIDNWFEESELRKSTGNGRTIRGTHFGKISFDPENPKIRKVTEPVDDTYRRVIGDGASDKTYFTFNSLYGTKNLDEKVVIKKKNVDPQKQMILYTGYLNKISGKPKLKDIIPEDEKIYQNRLAKPPNQFYNYVGYRHMYTQDRQIVPREQAINFVPIEKVKKMGQEAAEEEAKLKKESLENNDDESTLFWLPRINTGNVYRSFTKGPNPWGKSHAFTQPIQKTRGAWQFNFNSFNGDVNTKEGTLPYLKEGEVFSKGGCTFGESQMEKQ